MKAEMKREDVVLTDTGRMEQKIQRQHIKNQGYSFVVEKEVNARSSGKKTSGREARAAE